MGRTGTTDLWYYRNVNAISKQQLTEMTGMLKWRIKQIENGIKYFDVDNPFEKKLMKLVESENWKAKYDEAEKRCRKVLCSLSRIRIARGISIAEMARMTGLAETTIMNYEKAQSRPGRDVAEKLAYGYMVDINDLRGGRCWRGECE